MSAQAGPAVVLGIGNELLGDDGAGVAVVRELGRLVEQGDVRLPEGTTLLDGGTLGLGLLPWVADARTLIIVDAAELGRPPGSVAVLAGDDHLTGELPAAVRTAGAMPGVIAIVAVQPGALAPGIGLSDAVRSAIPTVVAAVLRTVGSVAAEAGTTT